MLTEETSSSNTSLVVSIVHTHRQGIVNSLAGKAQRFGANWAASRMTRLAGEGFKAPGVVVSYTTDPDIQSGKKFLNEGLQTAAGVPLQCDEGPDFKTFRVGLLG